MSGLQKSMDTLVGLALHGTAVEIKTTPTEADRFFANRAYPPTWNVTLSTGEVEVGRNDKDLATAIEGAIRGFQAARP